MRDHFSFWGELLLQAKHYRRKLHMFCIFLFAKHLKAKSRPNIKTPPPFSWGSTEFQQSLALWYLSSHIHPFDPSANLCLPNLHVFPRSHHPFLIIAGISLHTCPETSSFSASVNPKNNQASFCLGKLEEGRRYLISFSFDWWWKHIINWD